MCLHIWLYCIDGAKVNNILCEEIVRLFSSLKYISPNVTIINLASKMKATKNQTMKYIMDMEKETRDTMISCILNISFNMKKNNISHVIKMHEDITNHIHEKNALKQKKRCGHIEQMFMENFEAGCSVLEGIR